MEQSLSDLDRRALELKDGLIVFFQVSMHRNLKPNPGEEIEKSSEFRYLSTKKQSLSTGK